MSDAAYKRCGQCGETKPLEAFYRSRKNKDGRHTYCKPCAAPDATSVSMSDSPLVASGGKSE